MAVGTVGYQAAKREQKETENADKAAVDRLVMSMGKSNPMVQQGEARSAPLDDKDERSAQIG
jgi:hypothetical protein